MKILYVANERDPAQLAANALRTLGEDVRLEWARDLSSAASWAYYNRDVAALIVEAELQNQSCAAFVDDVRSLGLAAPVIVVCPDDVRTPLLALKAGADDYVVNNQSLHTNLPGVIARALQRVQATAHLSGKQPLRLFYVGDAALARRCLENSGWSIEISEAERTSNGTFQPIPPASAAGDDLPFDVLLVEHDHPEVEAFAILKEIASRRPNVRVILVVEWDEKLAIPAMKLGASDCVVKAADTFRALFFKLDRSRADVPLLEERSSLAAEETASRESLEREVKAFEARLERQNRADADAAEAGRIRRTLEEKLAAAEAALAESEQQRALAAADSANHLAKPGAEYRATLAQTLRARDALKLRDTLEQRLSEAVAALAESEAARQAAEERASAERVAASKEAAERHAALEERLVQEAARNRALEEARQHDTDAERAARAEAEQRHASELAAADARLSERQAAHDAALTQATRSRDALEQQLREAAKALEEARQAAAADAHAGAERFRLREVELGATISEVTTARTALETQLTETEHALQRAMQRAAAAELAAAQQAAQHQATAERHASEVATARAQLAEHQALSDRALSEAAAAGDALGQQLRDVTAALERALEEQAAEAAAAADRLARREAELGVTIAETVTTRDALVQKLADADIALSAAQERAAAERSAAVQQAAQLQTEFEARLAREAAARGKLEQSLTDAEVARQRHLAEAAAAMDRLARREAELGATIQEGIGARTVLEQKLADAETSRQQVERQHTSELAAAAARFSERQVHHDAQVAQAGATREALEQRLRDVTAALDESQQQRETEAAVAAGLLERHKQELGAALADAIAGRDALAQQLVDAKHAFDELENHAAEERLNAAREGAHHKTELDSLVAEHAATCKTLEQSRADADTARQKVQRHKEELATAAARLAERQAEHDAMAAHAGAVQSELEGKLEETAAALAKSRAERDALHQSLGRTQEQLQRLTDAHNEAQRSHERARAASEDEHRRLSADRASLQETLGRLHTQFEAPERVSAAHAAERARLDGVVTERDAQLNEQAATHQASQHAAQRALTQLEEKLRLALETSDREVARFQNELGALGQELDVARRDRDTLRTQADRLPQVLAERDESRADNRRLFEHSPVGQFRCDRDGSLTQMNRAFVGLLGYRTGDALRKVDFAKTVFESADDLQWLIERCLNSGTAETVETMWRRKNGRRIVVKLVGVAASRDSIEIVVEDITEIRELEERLRRAQHMEAVGRLASEVAATCDNLLRDVSHDGQQWLAAMHDDTVLRHQGEMLLGEVTRAASFLRQLSVYGNKQTIARGPANLQRVLRDLEPVLKRVAGDDIELVLPKPSPLNVDVEPERMERVFVNVASYARERMPHGGRLNIELTTAIVDRRFVAKYPNVRPGDHVLITITEVRGTVHTGLPTGPRDDSAAAVSRSAPEKPGVDLGALLSLVGDCGGHLWMSAEPPGNMVLKIHLPRPASDGQQDRHAPVPRPDQRRTRARWFRH